MEKVQSLPLQVKGTIDNWYSIPGSNNLDKSTRAEVSHVRTSISVVPLGSPLTLWACKGHQLILSVQLPSNLQ